MENLTILKTLPTFSEEINQKNILNYFKGPTLIELDFDKKDWVVVSILLHGNETVGLELLNQLKKVIGNRTPNRNLAILVGNVQACAQNLRHLSDQMDFNRIWSDEGENLLARDFIGWIKDKKLFASIDLHNNTGKNPLYACITHIDPQTVYLGSLFSRNLVFFEEPKHVFSRRFGALAPSITLECGQSCNQMGRKKSVDFVHDVLHMGKLNLPVGPLDLSIYHTVIRVKVPQDLNVGFQYQKYDLVFPENIDEYNFTPLKEGQLLAKTKLSKIPLHLINDQNEDLTNEYLHLNPGGDIILKKEVVPSMFTKDLNVMKSDSFGYLMETYDLGDK